MSGTQAPEAGLAKVCQTIPPGAGEGKGGFRDFALQRVAMMRRAQGRAYGGQASRKSLIDMTVFAWSRMNSIVSAPAR